MAEIAKFGQLSISNWAPWWLPFFCHRVEILISVNYCSDNDLAYRAPLSLLEEYGLSNDFDGKRTHMLHIASAGVIDVQTTRNTNTSKGRVIHRLKGTQKSFQI